MKRIFTLVLLSFAVVGTSNASDKFGDLTSEYFYGKNSTVSVDVRRVIAKDPQTAPKVLKILSNDKDSKVRELVKANPSF